MNALADMRVAWLAALLLGALAAVPVQAADTVVYYHTDALHSVTVVTNAQGQVLERTHYAPYGTVLNRGLRDGPGYTGHQEDAATGLVYMQQRYYDPATGRFLSADPVQADDKGGSFNRYWYANDNPYRYTDPDGRCADGTCGVIVRNYGAWANANPEAADKIGSTVGVAGVTAMLSVTGVPEAVGVVGATRAAVRYIGSKIAGTAVRRAAVDGAESAAKGGRAANKLRPHQDATGAHTAFKQGADGKVSNYATYRENPQNPSGFQVTKRVDVTGKAHTNPDGNVVSTPHVKEGSSRYVRPARKDEIPGG